MSSRPNLEAAYDAIADDYDSLFPDFRGSYTEWRSGLHNHLIEGVVPRGARILDLCCGTGRQSIALAEEGYEVVAVDHSTRMLCVATDIALHRGVRVDFRKGDVRKISRYIHAGERFERFICCGSAILHFTEKEIRLILRQLSGVLKPPAQGIIDVFDWGLLPKDVMWTPRAHKRDEREERLVLEFYERRREIVNTSLIRLHRVNGEQWSMATSNFCYWCHSPERLVEILSQEGFNSVVKKRGEVDKLTAIIVAHKPD